jgi:hypothetical protein
MGKIQSTEATYSQVKQIVFLFDFDSNELMREAQACITGLWLNSARSTKKAMTVTTERDDVV